MSEADKRESKDLIEQLKAKDLPEKTRDYLLNRLESITSKYI